MEGFNFFIPVRMLIGAYLIYAAIRGKGPIFQNDYLRCTIEAYVKVMRILCAIAGVIVILGSALELWGIADLSTTAGWIIWGAGMAVVAAMLIFPLRMTDRTAAALGKRISRHENEPAPDPYAAAFDFPEAEKTPAQSGSGKPKKGK